MDLPKHGERINGTVEFEPWSIVPELSGIMDFVKDRWKHISLYASSIGAWFSMLSFGNEPLKNCLFVSTVLDYERTHVKDDGMGGSITNPVRRSAFDSNRLWADAFMGILEVCVRESD